MSRVLIVLAFCLLCLSAICQFPDDVFVDGYVNRNGTYVQPHFRTAPNSSMFDNYSTKGNYNPYTGKPGWIEPYSKVSTSYYNNIPYNDKSVYNYLIIYLNKKDSYNYFRIIDDFGYEYKLFFTGIFKMNNNQTKEANEIFHNLINKKGVNKFIFGESNYWFDVTSKYIDANSELNELYINADRFQKDGNYKILEQALMSIKNPLNFYHKFVITFVVENQRHNYSNAMNAYDSMIFYTSESSYRDSLILRRGNILEGMTKYENTIRAFSNGTYYYKIQKLADNLEYYIINKKTPFLELRNACFEVEKESCTSKDSAFARALWDTSKNVKKDKNDLLYFTVHPRKKNNDTTFIISLVFFDDSSYSFYNNQLSIFKNQPISNSLAYNYENINQKEHGFEYMLNQVVIAGLTTTYVEADKESPYRQKNYNLYLYSIIDKSSRMYKFSETFK